ncbi:MAG: hypothetical protein KDD44_05065, partial [Bdellovibrionales bacterium]|nr:hypothetical protein [Bdellovibrionales bacterium]
LRKALKIGAHRTGVITNLSSMLVMRERHKDAIELIASLPPNERTSELEVTLAIAHEALGETAQALKHYHQAREKGNADAEVEARISELKQSGEQVSENKK